MNTVIHAKVDKDLKERAEKVARHLGFSLAEVINASLSNFIRTREVDSSSIPKLNPKFERLLERIDKDIKEGKNLSPAFSSVAEMNKYLDSL